MAAWKVMRVMIHGLSKFDTLISMVSNTYSFIVIDQSLWTLLEYHAHKQVPYIDGSCYLNVSLILHGCLGASPQEVSTVFSLRTLELYQHIRVRQPRVSMQAWIKVLCDMHNVRMMMRACCSLLT